MWGGKGWRSTLGERSLESTGELQPDVKGLKGERAGFRHRPFSSHPPLPPPTSIKPRPQVTAQDG